MLMTRRDTTRTSRRIRSTTIGTREIGSEMTVIGISGQTGTRGLISAFNPDNPVGLKQEAS
jgi:hypothetical protein